MKIKNNKTGEIIDVYKGQVLIHFDNGRKTKLIKSLDELKDWEDYEEPKGITDISLNTGFSGFWRVQIDYDNKEQAEKAVEKLKALKRLKDKGFSITLQCRKGYAWLEANWGNLEGDYSDVLLLFGGKI